MTHPKLKWSRLDKLGGIITKPYWSNHRSQMPLNAHQEASSGKRKEICFKNFNFNPNLISITTV